MPILIPFSPEQELRFRETRYGKEFYGRHEGEGTRNAKHFLRMLLLRKWKFRCAYCQQYAWIDESLQTYFPDTVTVTDDHVVPAVQGGEYCCNNIVPSCKRCNSKRGQMPVSDFLESIGYSRQQVDRWLAFQRFSLPVSTVVDAYLELLRAGRRHHAVEAGVIVRIADLDRHTSGDADNDVTCKN